MTTTGVVVKRVPHVSTSFLLFVPVVGENSRALAEVLHCKLKMHLIAG